MRGGGGKQHVKQSQAGFSHYEISGFSSVCKFGEQLRATPPPPDSF